MSLKQYFGSEKSAIACFGIIFVIINLILLSSNNLKEAAGDILYMDVLIVFTAAAFLFWGFKKRKDKYYELINALSAGNSIDTLLPDGRDFYNDIIRKILNHKNDEMYNKTKELKENLDDVNDYIVKWVHEIKIPMSVCEIISDELPDELSESLKMEVERMNFLVEQVLYTSRASNYSKDLQINEVNIEKIVRGVVRKNTSFFISNKIDLQLLNLKFSVMTDEKWASYVLDQIINNACKYSYTDGKIKIWAEEDDKTVKLHVRDNGTGIAAKDIGRIFDKGFTGGNGRRVKKSTGIGLYISKKMFKSLGHDITVSSMEGEYTEFTLIFYKISNYFSDALM